MPNVVCWTHFPLSVISRHLTLSASWDVNFMLMEISTSMLLSISNESSDPASLEYLMWRNATRTFLLLVVLQQKVTTMRSRMGTPVAVTSRDQEIHPLRGEIVSANSAIARLKSHFGALLENWLRVSFYAVTPNFERMLITDSELSFRFTQARTELRTTLRRSQVYLDGLSEIWEEERTETDDGKTHTARDPMHSASLRVKSTRLVGGTWSPLTTPHACGAAYILG